MDPKASRRTARFPSAPAHWAKPTRLLAETSLALLFGVAFGLSLILAGGCNSSASASGLPAQPALIGADSSDASAAPSPTPTTSPEPRPSLPAPIPTLVLSTPSPEPSINPIPTPAPTATPTPAPAPTPTPTSSPVPSPVPSPSSSPASGVEASIVIDGSSAPIVVRFDSDGVLIEALPTVLRADAELTLDTGALPDISGTSLSERCDSAKALLDTDEALDLVDTRIGTIRLTLSALVGPSLSAALKSKADDLGLKNPVLLVKNGLQIESISASLESIDPDHSLLAALTAEDAYRHELDARTRAKLFDLRREGTATIVADSLAAVCDLASGVERLSLEVQGSLAHPDGSREHFTGSITQRLSLASPR